MCLPRNTKKYVKLLSFYLLPPLTRQRHMAVILSPFYLCIISYKQHVMPYCLASKELRETQDNDSQSSYGPKYDATYLTHLPFAINLFRCRSDFEEKFVRKTHPREHKLHYKRRRANLQLGVRNVFLQHTAAGKLRKTSKISDQRSHKV